MNLSSRNQNVAGLTPETFSAMLEEVDAQLRSEGVEIPARPIQAIIALGNRLNVSLPLVSPGPPASEDDFSAFSITSRIHFWYTQQYGARLGIDPAPSWFACLLCADRWRVRIPWLVAGVVVAAIRDPNVKSSPFGFRISDGRPRLINVFDLVEHLPEALRTRCTDSEQNDLQHLFGVAVDLSKNLAKIRKLRMVEQALGDFVASVDKFVQQPKDLGGSRWASLQFVEKLLKAFVLVSGGTPSKKGHLLKTYSKEAEAHGLQTFPNTIYEAVQCDPGVRYGDLPVTLTDAMLAHHEAMRLGVAITEAICIVAEGKGLFPTDR